MSNVANANAVRVKESSISPPDLISLSVLVVKTQLKSPGTVINLVRPHLDCKRDKWKAASTAPSLAQA